MSAEHDIDWLCRHQTHAVRSAGCRIIHLLKSSPRVFSKPQIASELGTSLDTTRRAMDWLTWLGAPIERCPSRGGWWLPGQAWCVPWSEMTPDAQISTLERIIEPGAHATLVDCISRLQRDNLALRSALMDAHSMPNAPAANDPSPALTVAPEATSGLQRGERELPPTRLACETVKVRLGQTPVFFHFGFDRGGKLCECSIDMGKAGSGVRGYTTAIAKLASHYLQIGGDPAVIAGSLRGIQFEPNGPNFADGDSTAVVEEAVSIVDAFAQALLYYSERGE